MDAAFTRRDFLAATGAGLLWLAAPALPAPGGRGPRALAAARGHAQATSPAATFVELRRGAGIFTAQGGTIGWLATADGALVVDSQYEATARTFLAGFRERTDAPIHALVNTHHHGDHTGGNGVLREAARRIVAHAGVPELQRRDAARRTDGFTPTVADTTFDEAWTLELGDERIRAAYHGAAHTGADCVVACERAGVVHLGDLVFNRGYPFIDRASGASVAGWIAVLERVLADHPADTIYIFGHGLPAFGVTGDAADVAVQRDLLGALLEHATRAVAAGLSREEATAPTAFGAFPDHRPLVERLSLGFALGAAYDEVAGR
jgi:cyclase